MTTTIRRLAVVLAVLAFLVGPSSSPVAAHPEGEAHHSPLPAHANEVMRAQFRDHHGSVHLAAASSLACTNGVVQTADEAYPCDNVDLESFMPLEDLGAASNEEANDIWGWTDSATGSEYALMGMTFGTAFVDVSNPSAPVYLGELPTHGAFGSSWRDIKVFNDHAFIVSEARGHGMQVFDLTQLRNASGSPQTFAETAFYNKVSSSHNIVINEDSGYAYIVGAAGKNSCNGGLHIVDINNPTNPRQAGCFDSDGYTHDAQCVIYSGPDPDHSGSEICLNSNEDTLTIVDVSNKSNPIQLARLGYSGAEYTHQGWLTEDQRYFLVDDELDESRLGHNTRTRVFDVSDLDNPSLVGFYDAANPAIDHNQYIKGNYSYQSNYRAGLRILDISGAATASLTEVAYFDIWPADDAAQFNANWSNYPYFDSGIVIMSGIEQGLFVVRPDLGGGNGGDNPPAVSVTDPGDGATVSGTTTLAASASDDVGVTQVDFRIDGTSVGTDTDGSDGWSISWDSSTTSDGNHQVTAVATDTAGQTASDSVSINVSNGVVTTVHVDSFTGSSAPAGRGGKWDATFVVSVVDSSGSAVGGVAVTARLSTGGDVSCTTDSSGSCTMSAMDLRRNDASVTATITSLSGAGIVYDPGANVTDSVTVLAP